MGKAVINCCYGGFGISEEAYNWLKEHNINEEFISKYMNFDRGFRYGYGGPRHHPFLIQCVEELGEKASGWLSDLKVVEFEGNLYRINEYDGYESIDIPSDLIWKDCNDY